MINPDTLEPYQNRPKNNLFYQIQKSILIVKLNQIDIIASPWNVNETVEWYKKYIGEDDIKIEFVDIENEGLWNEISEDDEEYEELSQLFYINNFIELIRFNSSDKFNNVRIIDGNICKYISFKEYCEEYLKHGNNMKEPEVIASTEY